MPNQVLQLDRLLRTSLTAFLSDATAEQWQGKDRDSVNRFAMGYLVAACGKHHVLQHATQIGIEMAVAQPSRVDARQTAPTDVVIWRKSWSTCWDDDENAALAPLAVIEWKVSLGWKGGRDTTQDATWLQAFAKGHPKRVRYSIAVRFRDGDEHYSVAVSLRPQQSNAHLVCEVIRCRQNHAAADLSITARGRK